MKPFVVYIDVNTDEITLSKKEFEKFLKEAYEQGHDEGYNKGLVQGRSYSGWWNSPQITTSEIRYGTVSPSEPNPITITCDNNNKKSTAVNDIISNLFNSVGD